MPDNLRILVVDGDDVDRMAVRRALNESGIECKLEECRTGGQAIDRLRASGAGGAGGAGGTSGVGAGEPFHCVVMDNLLPDRPGLQVLQALRGAGILVPVIMMTGQGSEELAVDLMKAGAADYLAKGRVSSESLVRSIRTAVRVARA